MSANDVGIFLVNAGIMSRETEEWKHRPRRGEKL